MTKDALLMWGALAIVVAAVMAGGVRWIGDDSGPKPATTPVLPPVTAAPLAASDPAPPTSPTPGEYLTRDAIVGEPLVLTDADIAAAEVEQVKLEIGTGTLSLRLVGDTSGESVTMRVRLWRLGVPESAAWTGGDVEISSADVPEGGCAFDFLASGWYRVQCLDLRSGVGDPPEFRVGDGATEITLKVAERRTFRERLLLVDEQGTPIVSAKRRRGPGGSMSSSPDRNPSWASPRRLKAGSGGSSGSGFGVGCGPGETKWSNTTAGSSGFHDLGTFRERGHSGRSDWSWNYSPDGVSTVDLRSNDASASDVTFVGVAPRAESILATLTRADGAPIDRASAKVLTQCNAVRGPWDSPPDAWRTIPVTVTVTCDGYVPLQFEWHAATASEPTFLTPDPR